MPGPGVDPNTGLIYLRARWYDPGTGQFITRDPLEAQTRQPYAYGLDNPLNVTDPSGLDGILGTGIGPTIGPQIHWGAVGTGYVGFVDGLTSPAFGGTAAIRDAIPGANGGPDKCSALYKLERTIGQATAAAAAGAAGGWGVGSRIVGALGEGAGGSGSITSFGTLLTELADSTGHLYLFLGTSVAATAVGPGWLTWEAGQVFSGGAAGGCGCSG